MYKITLKVITSYGEAFQEINFRNKPDMILLTKIAGDLFMEPVILPESLRLDMWELVGFAVDSKYAGSIKLELIKFVDDPAILSG